MNYNQNHKIAQITPKTLVIGIDIAKHHHVARAQDYRGMELGSTCAIVIVVLSRTIALYISLASIKGFSEKYKVILNWGGLKGSLSIALALSLPRTFEGRDDILILTFSVVLFSLLIQGLSITPLIKKLGIKDKEEEPS